MLGTAGIVLSLLLLMYFAYRGINVLVLAPLMALLAVVFGGGARYQSPDSQALPIGRSGLPTVST